MACERPPSLMAAPYRLMFRAIALTLRAGLRGLRPPSAPQRRLRDIFLMSRPPLLREEGSVLPEKLCQKNKKVQPCYPSRHSRNQKGTHRRDAENAKVFSDSKEPLSRFLCVSAVTFLCSL